MDQYISKSAVKTEIESIKHKLLDNIICERDKEWAARTAHQLNRIILFIDNLEVKEVDLEKELRDFVVGDIDDYDMGLAKHFFELGLKAAQKGE